MKAFTLTIVRSEKTGRIVYFEVFESTGMNPKDLATRIVGRETELFKQYGYDTHDVFSQGFSSLEAMHHKYPEIPAKTTH